MTRRRGERSTPTSPQLWRSSRLDRSLRDRCHMRRRTTGRDAPACTAQSGPHISTWPPAVPQLPPSSAAFLDLRQGGADHPLPGVQGGRPGGATPAHVPSLLRPSWLPTPRAPQPQQHTHAAHTPPRPSIYETPLDSIQQARRPLACPPPAHTTTPPITAQSLHARLSLGTRARTAGHRGFCSGCSSAWVQPGALLLLPLRRAAEGGGPSLNRNWHNHPSLPTSARMLPAQQLPRQDVAALDVSKGLTPHYYFNFG